MANSATWHRSKSLTTVRSTTAARSTQPPLRPKVPSDGKPPSPSPRNGAGPQPDLGGGAEDTVARVTLYPDDEMAVTEPWAHIGKCGPEYRYFCVNGGKCSWLRLLKKPACRYVIIVITSADVSRSRGNVFITVCVCLFVNEFLSFCTIYLNKLSTDLDEIC